MIEEPITFSSFVQHMIYIHNYTPKCLPNDLVPGPVSIQQSSQFTSISSSLLTQTSGWHTIWHCFRLPTFLTVLASRVAHHIAIKSYKRITSGIIEHTNISRISKSEVFKSKADQRKSNCPCYSNSLLDFIPSKV